MNGPEVLERVKHADLVFGVNKRDGSQTIFYGTDLLQLIVDSSVTSKLKVLRVEVDWDTDEPEILAAMCITAKGQCDW